MVLDGRSSQEYPVNARIPVKAPFLALTFPTIYTLMTFLMMLSVILLSILMILLSTLNAIWHLICGNNWMELASELESALKDTVDLGREWLVDFNAGKTQLVSFHQSNNTGAIDVKMDGYVLEEKSCFKMLGLILSSRKLEA